MQVLEAGPHKLLLLEIEPEVIASVVKQAGFEFKVQDGRRVLELDLSIPDRQAPLLLFDASDPGNLGWFSRCQFYVDGRTGAVLQTPIFLANQKTRGGKILANAVRLQIAKELPSSFRLPGRQTVTEQMVYAVLYNLLMALQKTGVGVCGGSIVRPLAGRTEGLGTRN